MALFQIDFSSNVLQLSTSMNVILPSSPAGAAGYPTLFLLHGLSDDHTIWQRRTSIERYAEEYGLAVVMPGVHRSFYTDMKNGYDYWKFVSEEVPGLVRSWFPLSAEREDNFAAGLSMGGYGAFKLVLRKPEMFAAGASLSGALDMVDFPFAEELLPRGEFARIFGSNEELRGGENDLMHAAERLAGAPGPKPALYQCCGTEDFLYGINVRFRDHVKRLGFDFVYEEGPGNHDWGYWDENIRKVLAWLPIRRQ